MYTHCIWLLLLLNSLYSACLLVLVAHTTMRRCILLSHLAVFVFELLNSEQLSLVDAVFAAAAAVWCISPAVTVSFIIYYWTTSTQLIAFFFIPEIYLKFCWTQKSLLDAWLAHKQTIRKPTTARNDWQLNQKLTFNTSTILPENCCTASLFKRFVCSQCINHCFVAKHK